MKMKNLLLLPLLLLLSVFSCKKEAKQEEQASAATEDILEIKTIYGNMYIWLYKETPQHRQNYITLASTNYLDSTTFHRVIPNFMIQGGDPNSKDKDSTNDGTGGPSYTIPAEIDSSKFKHDRGAVGAARTNNPQKASSGSQFYIVQNQAGAHWLDGAYTVFGKVIKGIEVSDSIVKQPRNSNDRPYKNIYMDVNVVKKTLDQLQTEFNFVP
jgi:peptidylprolyl isomerase/peptidyl-prolyl cis-trans isomerase B (cyclophilin B)